VASFFAQQLDLLSLTRPPTFDRRGQSRAVREAIFSVNVLAGITVMTGGQG